MMVRTLFKADIDQILMIEESVNVAPWTKETFQACLRVGYIGWVIEEEKKIIGFLLASITYEECHILNIAIARDHQRHGYGKILLETLLAHAKEQGTGIAYLEVRRSNAAAIALYQQLQFQLIGERKGYYPTVSDKEDALIFAKSLQTSFDFK